MWFLVINPQPVVNEDLEGDINSFKTAAFTIVHDSSTCDICHLITSIMHSILLQVFASFSWSSTHLIIIKCYEYYKSEERSMHWEK